MRKIFGFAKGGATSNSSSTARKVALITNYNSCPLGVALAKQLIVSHTVVAVSHSDSESINKEL